MYCTQDKQPRRPTARVLSPGSLTAATPTKAGGGTPISPPSLVVGRRSESDPFCAERMTNPPWALGRFDPPNPPRCIGELVRQGQAEGTIASRGGISGNRPRGDDCSSPAAKVRDYVPGGGKGLHEHRVMAGADPERFEQARADPPAVSGRSTPVASCDGRSQTAPGQSAQSVSKPFAGERI